MRSSLNKASWIEHRKMCRLCKANNCSKGSYVTKPFNRTQQVWICRTCLIKGIDPLIVIAIKFKMLPSEPEARAAWTHAQGTVCEQTRPERCACYQALRSLGVQAEFLSIDDVLAGYR